MQHVFGEHIGPTVEAYVDDFVVKTKKVSNLINDLDVVFKCLRAKNIKLNPEKCVFGVPRGMLLGFIISERGIKANPEKITTITKMGPIRDLKGVQRVTGCLVALSRFISCLGEKALPLYRLLKKSEHFSWTLEAERSPYKAQSYIVQLTDPRPSDHRGTPPALHRRNDTSGQRGLSCRKGRGRTYLARSEASLLCQ
jgi:hypothetical protein